MTKPLHLEIVTPEKVVVNETVSYVAAPGILGEFGVLPGHLPLLSALVPGKVTYQVGDNRKYAFVGGGFAEVTDNKISVLAESAEQLEEIDVERARRAYERARKRFSAPTPDIDVVRAEAALNRAIQRLNLVAMK